MKRNNIFTSFAALFMGVVIAAVSCQEPAPEEKPVEPVFPSFVEKTVSPGDEVSLSVYPNLDWEVTVPESTLQWFWIQDGAFKSDRCSGKAGEQVTVIIGVSETEEFDMSRSCEVTMTMGDESMVIAKLIRPGKDKALTVYTAKVVDGEIQFVADGSSYDYHSEEAESIDLIWTGSDFRLPVMVESNCDWTIKAPSWADIDVPVNSVGTVYVNVYGVPSEYPEDAASGKIQFIGGDTVIKEYAITIPGCVDKFSYTVDMSLTELDFNFSGQVKTAMGYIDGPVSASVSGTSGLSVFAVECIDGKFDVISSEEPSWLAISEEAYDFSDGADVLQTRNVDISVSVNVGEDRRAVIFFMPPEGWTKDNSLFNDAMDAVREEYQQYAIPVIQHSSNQEFISMISDASDMAAGGAVFSVSEDESLYDRFGQSKYAYELLYTNSYARDNARMMFTSAVSSFKLFDDAGNDMTDSEDFFLSISMDEDMKGGVIDMVAEISSTGYVVLYNTSGMVLAVVKCVFDPELVIGEVADVAFVGESVTYAPMVGATLERLTEGQIYDRYCDGDALVYHLTYTTAGIPMRISIPNSIVSHNVNPYLFKSYIRVNDNVYDEVFVNGQLGGIELIDGGVDIYMEMPEGRNEMRGNINFVNSENVIVLVLVCTLDLSASGE